MISLNAYGGHGQIIYINWRGRQHKYCYNTGNKPSSSAPSPITWLARRRRCTIMFTPRRYVAPAWAILAPSRRWEQQPERGIPPGWPGGPWWTVPSTRTARRQFHQQLRPSYRFNNKQPRHRALIKRQHRLHLVHRYHRQRQRHRRLQQAPVQPRQALLR